MPDPILNIDSVLLANKHIPSVDRILNSKNYPVRKGKKGKDETHLMGTASDDIGPYAYPVLRLIDGKFVENVDSRDAVMAGDIIRFKTDADALYFTQHYKESALARGLLKDDRIQPKNKFIRFEAGGTVGDPPKKKKKQPWESDRPVAESTSNTISLDDYNRRKLVVDDQVAKAMGQQVGTYYKPGPSAQAIFDEKNLELRDLAGLDDAGNPKPLTKLASNKTFNALADNVVMPGFEIWQYLETAGLAGKFSKFAFNEIAPFFKEIDNVGTIPGFPTISDIGRLPLSPRRIDNGIITTADLLPTLNHNQKFAILNKGFRDQLKDKGKLEGLKFVDEQKPLLRGSREENLRFLMHDDESSRYYIPHLAQKTDKVLYNGIYPGEFTPRLANYDLAWYHFPTDLRLAKDYYEPFRKPDALRRSAGRRFERIYEQEYKVGALNHALYPKNEYGGTISAEVGVSISEDGDDPIPKKKPIFVSDPNDPRLKSYADSLYLHNLGNRLNATLAGNNNYLKVPSGAPYDKVINNAAKKTGKGLIDNTKEFKNKDIRRLMEEYHEKGNKGIMPYRYQAYYPNPDKTAVDLVTMRAFLDMVGITEPRTEGAWHFPQWIEPNQQVVYNPSLAEAKKPDPVPKSKKPTYKDSLDAYKVGQKIRTDLMKLYPENELYKSGPHNEFTRKRKLNGKETGVENVIEELETAFRDKWIDDNIYNQHYREAARIVDRANHIKVKPEYLLEGIESTPMPVYKKPVGTPQHIPRPLNPARIPQLTEDEIHVSVSEPTHLSLATLPSSTKYSFTLRDEEMDSKQRTLYFRDLESWKAFTEENGYEQRRQTGDGKSAQGSGYLRDKFK